MTRYIVNGGIVTLFDATNLPPRDTYGSDWIVVDATDEDDVIAQATAYDAGVHPAQTEMNLFAAAYKAEALDFA